MHLPADRESADVHQRTERLVREGLISAGTAAKLCHANPSTIARWGFRGVRTLGGDVVRLEIVRIGGRVMTSEAALLRFIARQQAERDGGIASGRSPAERRRAAATAALHLEISGA